MEYYSEESAIMGEVGGELLTLENAKKKKKKKSNLKIYMRKVERSWSGNLAQKPNFHERMRSRLSKKEVDHHHHHQIDYLLNEKSNSRSSSSASSLLSMSAPTTPTPRLVRSSGMRRDWSFEDVPHMHPPLDNSTYTSYALFSNFNY
ncbi:hypothetical protein ABFS82_01G111000 [Erythranthe guttata]|uniref:Uncharacterized protein n=1 Tax=Erythranthe guttata TaxID=4155 RepID=A0A022R2G4_ERYGU|nr:hypothetical protein MIMGU_mgv1a015768mg [Erythranthe guttata]